MSTKSTTTTSNSNTATTQPWGPLQAPLQNIISETNPLIGDSAFFKPPEQQSHTTGATMLENYAQSNNNGYGYFDQPLNSQTQFQPVMAGAQYDANQGANTLHNYVGNRTNAFDQGRADQWNQHRDAYLGDGSNPYLDQVIADSQSDAMNMIKGQFSGSGRSMGSGAFANVAADRLGQISTQARFNDYQNRYNQERSNFENLANTRDAQGYNAAGNLYGSGVNTILNAAPTLDNLDTARTAQQEQVLAGRANSMLQAGDVRDQLYRSQNIDPTIQSLATPMSLLSQPSNAFKTGTNTSTNSQTQPNNNFLGGAAQLGLGLLGGFF